MSNMVWKNPETLKNVLEQFNANSKGFRNNKQVYYSQAIMYVVTPFLNALGYNTFDMNEVQVDIVSGDITVNIVNGLGIVFSIETEEARQINENTQIYIFLNLENSSMELSVKALSQWESFGVVNLNDLADDKKYNAKLFEAIVRLIEKDSLINNFEIKRYKLFTDGVLKSKLKEQKYENEFIVNVLEKEFSNPSDYLIDAIIYRLMDEYSTMTYEQLKPLLKGLKEQGIEKIVESVLKKKLMLSSIDIPMRETSPIEPPRKKDEPVIKRDTSKSEVDIDFPAIPTKKEKADDNVFVIDTEKEEETTIVVEEKPKVLFVEKDDVEEIAKEEESESISDILKPNRNVGQPVDLGNLFGDNGNFNESVNNPTNAEDNDTTTPKNENNSVEKLDEKVYNEVTEKTTYTNASTDLSKLFGVEEVQEEPTNLFEPLTTQEEVVDIFKETEHETDSETEMESIVEEVEEVEEISFNEEPIIEEDEDEEEVLNVLEEQMEHEEVEEISVEDVVDEEQEYDGGIEYLFDKKGRKYFIDDFGDKVIVPNDDEVAISREVDENSPSALSDSKSLNELTRPKGRQFSRFDEE